MTTLLLLRHGRTTANASGVLAGWTPGVSLDDTGRAQADAVAARLGPVALAAVVSSPLERCQETATALLAGRDGLRVSTDERIGECRYGDWTGRPLKELAKDPLWKVVQQHPSAVVFPGAEGEALADTQARPFVVRVNDVGGDVSALVPPKKKGRRRARTVSDAVVGGGAGS
jgi:probable phosphomutase (TIGR03848 family)